MIIYVQYIRFRVVCCCMLLSALLCAKCSSHHFISFPISSLRRDLRAQLGLLLFFPTRLTKSEMYKFFWPAWGLYIQAILCSPTSQGFSCALATWLYLKISQVGWRKTFNDWQYLAIKVWRWRSLSLKRPVRICEYLWSSHVQSAAFLEPVPSCSKLYKPCIYGMRFRFKFSEKLVHVSSATA